MPCCPEQDEFQNLLLSFVRLISLLEKEQMSCYGLTPQQAYTMNVVAADPGIPMKALSEKLGVATSTLTRNIQKLETDGMLERTRTSDDDRSVLVYLTDEGRTKLEKVQTCYHAYFRDIFDKLGSDEKATVTHALRLLFKAVQECCQ